MYYDDIAILIMACAIAYNRGNEIWYMARLGRVAYLTLVSCSINLS
jgi:hypothetical protein